MNVGSIYRASHILPTQPPRADQDVSQVIGWRGNNPEKENSGTGIRPVADASVSMQGQRLGQIFTASA